VDPRIPLYNLENAQKKLETRTAATSSSSLHLAGLLPHAAQLPLFDYETTAGSMGWLAEPSRCLTGGRRLVKRERTSNFELRRARSR
jgi:hypothetical protein